MPATSLPRDPNNIPSPVANNDGTAGVIGLDSIGNARVRQGKAKLTTEKQVTIGTTPVLLLAANDNRKTATFQNISGSAAYLGSTNAVSVSTAAYTVPAGNMQSDGATAGDWYGVCASGTALIGVGEVTYVN